MDWDDYKGLTERFSANEIYLNNSLERIKTLAKQDRLVVTAEYCFFSANYPVSFTQTTEDSFQINGNGTLAKAIRQIQDIARDERTPRILGTVCEEVVVASGVIIRFNTAIVINHLGEIIQLRRKTTGSDSPDILDEDKQDLPIPERLEYIDLAHHLSWSTMVPVELQLSDEVVTALVLICAENNDPSTAPRLHNQFPFFESEYPKIDLSKVDLVIAPFREGSRDSKEHGYRFEHGLPTLIVNSASHHSVFIQNSAKES